MCGFDFSKIGRKRVEGQNIGVGKFCISDNW